MQNFPGVGVSPGRIIGTVRQMPKPISEPPAGEQLAPGTSAEDATAALKAASQAVHDELKARAAHATGDGKAVLEATALMAKDTMLIKGAAKLVARGLSSERAIWESGSSVSEMLHNLGGYMAERATDVLDVRARIVAALRGVPAPGIPTSSTPFVLVAEDLAPADTATLDPEQGPGTRDRRRRAAVPHGHHRAFAGPAGRRGCRGRGRTRGRHGSLR